MAVICVTLLWTVRKMAGVGLSPGDPNSFARPGMLGLRRCFQRFIKVGAMAMGDLRLMGCYSDLWLLRLVDWYAFASRHTA